MTVSIDVSTDYLLFDKKETITYYVKTGENQQFDAPITINNCLRRAQGQTLDDYSQVNSLSWSIPVVECPSGFVPKSEDELVGADSTRWIVGDVDYDTWVTRYRVPTKKKIS